MSDMTKSNLEENAKYEEVDHEDITVIEDVFVESDLDFRDVSYDTLQVAKLLGVQESTVRKYCALMVKQGYQFNKNSVGHRIFYKCDVDVMKEIIELKNDGVTLEEAVKTVLISHKSDTSNITDITSKYNRLLDEFEIFRKSQMEFNQQLLKKLDEQSGIIKKNIEERDKRLIQSIRQTLEMKQSKKKKSIFNFWR